MDAVRPVGLVADDDDAGAAVAAFGVSTTTAAAAAACVGSGIGTRCIEPATSAPMRRRTSRTRSLGSASAAPCVIYI
jgi:hypothetical protein